MAFFKINLTSFQGLMTNDQMSIKYENEEGIRYLLIYTVSGMNLGAVDCSHKHNYLGKVKLNHYLLNTNALPILQIRIQERTKLQERQKKSDIKLYCNKF